ncbi:carbohydrate ABC transporter permease [Paenarthrobacter nitroguajacolicus]|uniref:carbohydrate ABC transporter permease n=1 Tax=Paenarthrobacter nitroguajacolicus TaxID=211146 RepID=UPI0015BF4268|nr:carbohydrate ABC transporter permease [Paenarthrobacter nitroguajacolicus]NWL32213.1 sugar ABC transporter permease [Paenarthrobacter nitroguajacolicus]
MTTMATPTQPAPTKPSAPPVYNPKSESTTAKRIKSTIFHIVALGLVAMVLYPAIWMISASFKPNSEIGGANNALWSNNFSFDNFVTAMEGIGGVSTLTFFTNSLILAVGAVVGTVLSASISAYAFARINFPGRGLFFGMMIATLLLPFHVVIIPQYIVIQQLGLVDTYVPLLIGKFLAADAFFVFLMVQFMRGLPAELDEAARIDGAGHVRIFGSIMLPLMKPALISTSIFSFIWSWNDFLGPLLYLNTPEKYPLPLALRLFVDQTQSSDYGAMIAMSVLALLPVLVFFLVFQRYIVEGVSTQGLKG